MHRYRRARSGYGHGEECRRTEDAERGACDERREKSGTPPGTGEGAEEDVEATGVENNAGDPSNPATADAVSEEKRSAHPDEPAEGGEDEVDAPGAGCPDNGA
jgi:hypothetical protein